MHGRCCLKYASFWWHILNVSLTRCKQQIDTFSLFSEDKTFKSISTMTDERNDDEYEYEESYVYVDFDSKLLDEELLNEDMKIRFLGINTKQPIMQLNNQLFKGKFSMQCHLRSSFYIEKY